MCFGYTSPLNPRAAPNRDTVFVPLATHREECPRQLVLSTVGPAPCDDTGLAGQTLRCFFWPGRPTAGKTLSTNS